MLCYIYTIQLYKAVKKKELLSSVTAGMDLESTMLSEIPVRERSIPYDLTHMWNLMNKINW